MNILAFDLGGTKIAGAVVNSRGKVLVEVRVPAAFQKGKAAVLEQLVSLGRDLRDQKSGIDRIGIASAGPVDPKRGLLLNPTNFGKRDWGRVSLVAFLEKKLGLPVILENDAAAAILAEHWVGRARGYDNAMILTLGTGLGTGILCNGELVRAGNHLHTEAGHMIIRPEDRQAVCGCGNLGCAEALVSGRGFAHHTSKSIRRNLKAPEIVLLARQGRQFARDALAYYGENLAIAIHNYSKIFGPDLFVLTGSFAAAHDLFLPLTQKHLRRLMQPNQKSRKIPKIVISSLENQAGVIGAAYCALKLQTDRKPSKTMGYESS